MLLMIIEMTRGCRRVQRLAFCGTALGLMLAAASSAHAQVQANVGAGQDQTYGAGATADAKIAALEAAVEALRAQVAELKTAQAAAPKAPKGEEAKVSIAQGKPSIQSADGRFSANLHGVMQFDAAQYYQDKALPAALTDPHSRDLSSGTNFRRARIGIDGKAYGDFSYNVLLEFGGAGEEDAGHIQELWVQYNGLKPFNFRIGAFPPSIGLEDAGSTNGQLFLERPASADIARSLAGGDFREAAQLQAAGDNWLLSGAVTGRLVGVVNSTASGVVQPFDSQLGFVGRAVYDLIKTDNAVLQVGVHGSYVTHPADTGAAANATRYQITFQERPELRVDGTRLISTGGVNANHASSSGFEVAGQYGPFFAQGEYEHYTVDRRNLTGAAVLSDPDFNGYYVEGAWSLTGESRKFNNATFAFDAPGVRHPFSLNDGTWGAWELAARYSTIDLNYNAGASGVAVPADGVRGGKQSIFAGGVNWYVNPVVRFMLDYQHVKIDRLAAVAPFTTAGQSYDALSLRSQLAF
jgi:phosphate-selective porin OprO/OprP